MNGGINKTKKNYKDIFLCQDSWGCRRQKEEVQQPLNRVVNLTLHHGLSVDVLCAWWNSVTRIVVTEGVLGKKCRVILQKRPTIEYQQAKTLYVKTACAFVWALKCMKENKPPSLGRFLMT